MNQEEKRLIQNKYEIVSKIKQGGFGIVYKGYDHVFEKPVAIKAIEPSLLREARYIDLFLEEAKNAGKLSHNNIVHIYNLVRDENGQFFIIMEYIDGVDLGKILRWCQKRNMTIPHHLSVFIVKEICKALEYAHNKRDLMTDKPLRLVHQDISPSNIMASSSGHVKLIDFGLAKIRFQTDSSDQIVLSGKLPYMAPEQVNGGVIDRRTDIFSLGAVFYEMLTGERLFPLDDPYQTIELIKKCKIDASVLERHHIDVSLQQIVLKMLQRDSDQRYQGANGVYLDLVEYLMATARSVDFAEELGDFVAQVMESNGRAEESLPDGKANVTPTPAPAFDQFKMKEPKIVIDASYGLSSSEEVSDLPAGGSASFASEELQSSSDLKGEQSIAESIEGIIEDQASRTTPAEPVTGEPNSDAVTIVLDGKSINDDGDSKILGQPYSELEDINVGSVRHRWSSDQAHEKNQGEIFIDELGKSDNASESVLESRDGLARSAAVRGKTVTPSRDVSVASEEEGEDDLKTVIDVIRLSTDRHKKVFTRIGIGFATAAILFFVLDLVLQLTPIGSAIYDRLFPPAIRISSLPVGATVYLDNKPINGKTPLSIAKISPGVHELRLTAPGFSPLIKSIHVPSKGQVKVAGEKVRKGYDPYLFRFKSPIEITSEPKGATIYINQLLYPQKTPTTVEWEAGIPFSLEMEQENFQRLSGFNLNTLDGSEEIEDRRVWSFKTIDGEPKRYVVEGIFKKFIYVSCIPSGAIFYIDGSPTPSGRTDVSSTIALTMGKHEIIFQKAGFNSRTITVTVDKNGPESISVMLTRNVRFFAKDINDLGNNEIGARIVRIIQNNKAYPRNDRTPCELSLPPVDLQVVLSKEGYKDATVTVTTRDKDVVVKMEPAIALVEVIVTDGLTGLPLKDAQISYRPLSGTQTSETYFGATDENGRCTNKVGPGEYSFRVKKFGYFEKYAILNTKSGNSKLEFKLIIQ
ncbi:MAG: PEGA domain-containing protein [candidate division KSB1 bacterium]|nr:PEGA domain-containing protein [candidate division KSB1 bacterium]